MSNHLDLEEQEQIEQLRHFWRKWGPLISTVLMVAAVAFAGWNGWQYWQQRQATQAAAMADTLAQAVRSGDAQRTATALVDLQKDFSGVVQADMAVLHAAQAAYNAGRVDEARTALQWVADNASSSAYSATARLRLAAVLMEQGSLDEAIVLLRGSYPAEFQPLVDDRLGDALKLQGKDSEAITAYRKAWQAMRAHQVQYRALVGFKLNALGVAITEEGTQP